ncbi:MAG TPA: GGDEF domain-containing protein [Polyangia bacterium]|nr:GGDEF domain-containing protein [Polyangia bacterium]
MHRLGWPRRWTYPAIGILLSVALVAGLVTLRGIAARRAHLPFHVLEELARQPLVYGYLLAATLLGTTLAGWLTGRKEDQLEALSVTDPLTGLANRRRLVAAFADERHRADRYGTPLSLLLIDLDWLKQINDQRGHAAGDRALMLVADGLRRSCRITDLAARTGGDEFAVLAVNTTATEALALAHRVCATIRRLGAERFPESHSGTAPGPRPTVSIGVADLDCVGAPGFESLHAAADSALYAAKSAGRDRALAAPSRSESGTRQTVVDLRTPRFRRSPP